MHITVVGAGAVGGYFGARWQEAGQDVTYLVREGRRKQLDASGLKIHSPLGDLEVDPKAVTSVQEISACDLVFVAVKNYHLENALPDIARLAEKGAYVLPMLNGVEHVRLLQDACGQEKVLGGLVHIISTLDENGHVVHSGRLHHMTFGPLQAEQRAFCDELVEVSRPANMEVHQSSNIMVDMWKKYAFITAFSGTTTASRLPIDEVMACGPTAGIFQSVLEEMAALAGACGAALPDDYVSSQVAAMKHMLPGATSSMHQDFRKGLPIEVESLQGAAIRMAQEHGIPVATIATLYGLLKPYEHGQR